MESKTKINIVTTSDLNEDQLDELVFEKACQKYDGTFGEVFENNLKDLLLKQIFACSVLDFEVKNGGFDQFFLNAEDLVTFAKEGLLKIGALKHLELLQIAHNIYENQKEEFKNRRNLNLDDLDDKYYELSDQNLIRKKYVADNINLFFD